MRKSLATAILNPPGKPKSGNVWLGVSSVRRAFLACALLSGCGRIGFEEPSFDGPSLPRADGAVDAQAFMDVAVDAGGPGMPWAITAGGSLGDQALAVAVDDRGGVFWGGEFQGAVSVAGESLTDNGGEDTFVALYREDGTAERVRHWGGESNDSLYDLAAAPNGDILVVGEWSPGLGDYGAGVVGDPAGNADFLVHRLTGAGDTVWSHWVRSTGFDRGLSVAVNAQGEIYATGLSSGTILEGGMNLTADGRDLVLVGLDPDGFTRWVKVIGGSGDQEAVVAAGTDRVCVAGTSTGDVNLGGGPISVGDAASIPFVGCFDAEGLHLWSAPVGALSPAGAVGKAFGVALDLSGNVYVGGAFGNATVTFPTAAITADAQDGFLVRYDADGSFRWVRTVHGPDSDDVKDVDVDAVGRILVTGEVDDNGEVGGVALSAPLGTEDDVYAASFAPGGEVSWVVRLPSLGDDYGVAIAGSRTGAVFVAGISTAPFDYAGETLANAGDRDASLIKFVPPL